MRFSYLATKSYLPNIHERMILTRLCINLIFSVIIQVLLIFFCFVTLCSIRYVKRAGAVLAAGSLIAKLELEDPTKVTKAKKFDGSFPDVKSPSMTGEKLHQLFKDSQQVLQNFLDGYVLPSPHYEKRLEKTIATLTKCLKDPALPLLELQVSVI